MIRCRLAHLKYLPPKEAQIPLAQIWGGGAVASADGLRFVVPIRAVNTGPSLTYYGVENGATYLNFTSDQFTGFYGIVVPARCATRPTSWTASWRIRPV